MADPKGNSMADAKDDATEDPEALGSLFGKVKDHAIEVTARGPLPMMNCWTRSFAYQPRSLMQSALGRLLGSPSNTQLSRAAAT